MDDRAKLAELRRLSNAQRKQLRLAERAAGLSAADVHRQNMAERSREASRVRAEIGPPPPRDEELWKKYQFDLHGFLTENFPNSLGLSPLSDDHRRIIDRLMQTILRGGQDLTIAFRGAAKSSVIECSSIWATGYGHRNFFVPLGATRDLTQSTLDSVLYEFETNDRLLLIFPAACHAIRALEGIPQRARKQTINGEPTRVECSRQRIILPTVEGFEGSGAIIWPRSIMSSQLRGTKFKRPDGTQARPDFVAPDDLQTTTSAKKPGQVAKRLEILRRDVLRLAGHRKRLAINILGTILETDDVIDTLSKDKAWRTLRAPMLKSLPKHIDDWLTKYADIFTSYNPDDPADKERAEREAGEHYLANREHYDEGAEATWESCFDPDCEKSAIEHAMRIVIESGMEAFLCECQCDPPKPTSSIELMSPRDIVHKQSQYSQGVVPPNCNTLTFYIDVHPGVLYYRVWGWESQFTGYLIDKGTFPEQSKPYFLHKDINPRLKHLFPGLDEDAVIACGLDAVLHGSEKFGFAGLMKRTWKRTDDVAFRIRCGLVDANGRSRDTIVSVLSNSPYAANLHPSYGKGVGAGDTRISSYRSAKKQNTGPEWMFTDAKPGEVQGILIDTNYWKSRFHRGLLLPAGTQGSLSLYKAKPVEHKMAADHYVSETPRDVTIDGHTITEFKLKSGSDNHIFDADVGNLVAASRCGITNVTIVTKAKPKQKPKPRRKFYNVAW